jgi:hypothetical protein
LSEEDKQDWFQTFPAEKHYSGVRLSQGEVLMDMDFGNHWTGAEPPEGQDYTSDVCFNIELTTPTGTVEKLTLTGPMTQRVYVGPNGEASDTGGNGREEVATELVSLSLRGVSPSLGSITISLNTNMSSIGLIEERANNTAGILDIPPFTPTGDADSFFNVFFQFEVGGTALMTSTSQPIRLTSVITHLPPVEDYSDISQTKVELLDQNGQPTGFYFGPITSCQQPPPTSTPAPVTFPQGDWPTYAQDEISVHPEPPSAGSLTRLCAEVVNNDPVNAHVVTLEFRVANFGIGLPWNTVGSTSVHVPSGSIGSGCVVWTPPGPGHWCIEVVLHQEGAEPQHSQRNIDADEPLQPGEPHSLTFPVGNPLDHPVHITL